MDYSNTKILISILLLALLIFVISGIVQSLMIFVISIVVAVIGIVWYFDRETRDGL